MKTSIVLAAAAALGITALAPAARSQSQFDGTYRGEPTSGNGCSLLHPALRVSNGIATMRYNPSTTFKAKVEANGVLDAPAGKSRLTGSFSNGSFQGSVGSGRCQYALQLQR